VVRSRYNPYDDYSFTFAQPLAGGGGGGGGAEEEEESLLLPPPM
jgi:hypothetical protein